MKHVDEDLREEYGRQVKNGESVTPKRVRDDGQEGFFLLIIKIGCIKNQNR